MRVEELRKVFAKEILKHMIRIRDLSFHDEVLDEIRKDIMRRYGLSEGKELEALSGAVYELGDRLRNVDLALVEDYTGDVAMYLVVPRTVAEDERLLDAIADMVYDGKLNLMELVAKYLESCGFRKGLAKKRGRALPVVRIAEAWDIDFSMEYVDFDWHNYTGWIRLCLDDACIYEHVYYCNWVCTAHGVFKCSTYTFEMSEES